MLKWYFYDSVGSYPTGLSSCSKLDYQDLSLESAWVQILIPSVFSYSIVVFHRGGQVHVKTVSHVCHRLEIPKPIQSLKKAGNL